MLQWKTMYQWKACRIHRGVVLLFRKLRKELQQNWRLRRHQYIHLFRYIIQLLKGVKNNVSMVIFSRSAQRWGKTCRIHRMLYTPCQLFCYSGNYGKIICLQEKKNFTKKKIIKKFGGEKKKIEKKKFLPTFFGKKKKKKKLQKAFFGKKRKCGKNNFKGKKNWHLMCVWWHTDILSKDDRPGKSIWNNWYHVTSSGHIICLKLEGH